MVVSRVRILRGRLAALSFLPHGPLHRAAHNMAAAFLTVSQQEGVVREVEATVLYNIILEVICALICLSELRPSPHSRGGITQG